MKVCVVGAGYYAQFQLAAWARIRGVELAAIADPDGAKAAMAVGQWPQVEVFGNAADMVRHCRPDVLDIVTPEATHLELVMQFSGLVDTIICQKPLAPTFEEACALVAAAEQAGTRLLIHENFRWQPWFREARRVLDEGLLGAARQLTFRFRPGDGRGPDAYLARQPYFRTMRRFLVHETVVHYTDTFRFLLGEVSSVTARLRRENPVIAGEDAGIVIYEFTSGAVAILDANRDLDHEAGEPRYTQGSMLLEGESASLRLDGEARLWLRRRGEAAEVLHTAFERVVPNGDSVFNYQAAVVAALAQPGAGAMAGHARDYLRNLQVEAAIYRSAQEGRTVALQPWDCL